MCDHAQTATAGPALCAECYPGGTTAFLARTDLQELTYKEFAAPVTPETMREIERHRAGFRAIMARQLEATGREQVIKDLEAELRPGISYLTQLMALDALIALAAEPQPEPVRAGAIRAGAIRACAGPADAIRAGASPSGLAPTE